MVHKTATTEITFLMNQHLNCSNKGLEILRGTMLAITILENLAVFTLVLQTVYRICKNVM